MSLHHLADSLASRPPRRAPRVPYAKPSSATGRSRWEQSQSLKLLASVGPGTSQAMELRQNPRDALARDIPRFPTLLPPKEEPFIPRRSLSLLLLLPFVAAVKPATAATPVASPGPAPAVSPASVPPSAATPVSSPPPDANQTLPGGWSVVPGAANDSNILQLASFAVEEHNNKSTDSLKLLNVTSATQQVVAGINYNITLWAADCKALKASEYSAVLWVQSWLNSTKLTSLTLVPNTTRALTDAELSAVTGKSKDSHLSSARGYSSLHPIVLLGLAFCLQVFC